MWYYWTNGDFRILTRLWIDSHSRGLEIPL